MSMKQSFEEMIESRDNRRHRREARYIGKIEKKESRASEMIGTLIRDGREICYVYPVGGRYREGSRVELIQFLVRRKYV